jgi:pimeloyl-ACP methyl ester carboxylesterase
LVTVLIAITASAQDKAVDNSPHKVQMVAVDKGITLEVLDWGGTGRAIVFLSGMGGTAHDFDDLAPKLIGEGHIYGITRRGFGASSAPTPPIVDEIRRPNGIYEIKRHDLSESNPYDADRLGDDVLAVIDKLQLRRPVLIGHSIAGQELSSVASRHPEKVGGLVYLDALSSGYAFFTGPEEELPFSTKASRAWPIGPSPLPPITLSVITGTHKYSKLPVPVLALESFPRNPPPGFSAAQHADALARNKERLDGLERDLPTARIVRLAYADHYLWRTNEADVLREIRGFLSRLQ